MNAYREDGQLVQAKPLTNWKNAPSLLNLKQDLQDAKPVHDLQKQKIETWLDNLNVTGKAKVESSNGGSKIVPKLIRKQAEWRYAALSEPFLSTQDLFNVKPKTWEDREAAIQNEVVLNYQFTTAIDKTRFIDEYVRAAVDEGTVITRVGWEYDEEEYEAEVPIVEFRVNPEFGEIHQQLAELRETSPSQFDTDVPEELKQAHELTMEHQQPIEPVVLGTRMEKRTKVLYNRPTLEVCDFRNVVVDPTCKGDVTKAGFLVYTFESSLSVLKKDKRYKNLEHINLTGNSILNQPDHEPDGGLHGFNFSDDPRKKFLVHEYWGYWDIHGTGKVSPFVAAWVGDVMIRMEESPFPDKQIPFVIEQYLPVRRNTYGEPDGALLEDNQKVIGAVTRGMIDSMAKSANGQTGIRRDMLDVTNRRKFEKGMDYEFNANIDPRQGVFMHTYPEIPQSAQFMLQLQNIEAESLTGVKSFSQGLASQSLGDVATGIRGALDAASKRELGILRRLSNGIIKIGRKIISMNAEFLSEEEVVRVTNDQFVKIRKDALAGEFDLELSISTAEEDNNKAEQLAFMLQTVGPNGDPGLTKMILSDIAKLRKMPDLAQKIEAYEPQPDPMAEKAKQLELAKLEAEVMEIQARAMQLQASAQLDGAKAGTEQVKQGNIQSDTDQKNLDFVEQESGVKQERAKELHGEQARAQGQLKLLEQGIQSTEKAKDRQVDLLKEYIKSKSKAKAKKP
jgi:hypothetical protein